MSAIPMLPRERALEYRDFVAKIFTRSMPSCRQVLDSVVVPGLRVPGWPFGAHFVHEMFLPFRVADRDLFWSGPHYLPPNHGGIWEGFGIDVLEELEIAEDDPWDAAPLLLAWATTTVDNRNRRRIRMELARWGRKHPEGLLRLLATAFETNDPQMKEDLLSAAYGAACLTRPDTAWKPLCEWIVDSFFVSGAPLRTNNVVVRHAARGLVERALACGVQLDPQRLDALRRPLVFDQELLPIDLEAAQQASHHGAPPATSDLAWYVVPRAIDPFFDRMMRRSWTDDQEPSDNPPTLEDVSGFVLREIKIPAESLRRALRLVDLQGGRYIDSLGETLSFFHTSSTEGWWRPPSSQTLLVRRDAFEAALREAGLAPCWAVRLYREPSAALLQEGWTRTRFDWSSLSLFVDGELRTFELDRSVETFTPEPRSARPVV